MFLLFILFIGIHLVLAKEGTSDDKIVGGRIASNIPFLVSIQLDNRHVCGGSLITMTHILTACHCVGDYKAKPGSNDIEVPDVDDPSKYMIYAGDWDLKLRTFRSQKRKVKEMYPHPACIRMLGTLQWDFGLMIVDKPFEETKFVKPTKLYSMSKKTFEERIAQFQGKKRKSCWVMGWGKAVLTAEGAASSRYLKAVQMKIIADEECRYYLSQRNPYYVNYSFGDRAQMCATGLKWSESDCQGDSGGPVYCKGHLLGTVSYGFECGKGDQPAVYAKLSEFLSWYKTFVKKSEVRGRAKCLYPWPWILTLVICITYTSTLVVPAETWVWLT